MNTTAQPSDLTRKLSFRLEGWWRPLAAGIAILLLGLCAYTTYLQFMAAYHLRLALEDLGRPAVSEKDWMKGMSLLAESLRYSPGYPWSLETMAEQQVLRMRAGTLGPGPAADLPAVAVMLANVNFHHALVQRPTSAHAWAGVAVTKVHMGQMDAPFLKALRHADELAPWETEVQQRVLWASLAAWDRLDTGARAAAVGTLERAVHRDATRTTRLVQSFNRLDLLCGQASIRAKLKEVCSQEHR